MVYLRLPRTLLGALLLSVAAAAAGCSGAAARAAATPELAVHRGDFQERVLLTGELASERAAEVKVPQTHAFRLELRALVEDGTPVAAGQVLAELDNSQFTRELEDKRLENAEKRNEIARESAQGEADDAQRAFAVEEKRADVEKARIKAAVPPGLAPERERQERQLALRRAEVELAKAEADRAAHRKASAADVAVKGIELARGERQIAESQDAIASLALRAPRAGIALLGEDPWEGRKVRVGDGLFPGQTVVSLPDLAALAVEASLWDVDDGRVRPGMPARLTLDAYPGRSYAGRVAEVSPLARESARSSSLRSFQVKVALAERDLARMRPGMSVKVEVLGPARRGVLLAPRAALDLAAEPPRALLAGGGGGSVPVRLGACDPLVCVVLSGLPPGARLRPRVPPAPREATDAAAAAGAGG